MGGSLSELDLPVDPGCPVGVKTKGAGVLTPVSSGRPGWLEVQDHFVRESI